MVFAIALISFGLSLRRGRRGGLCCSCSCHLAISLSVSCPIPSAAPGVVVVPCLIFFLSWIAPGVPLIHSSAGGGDDGA